MDMEANQPENSSLNHHINNNNNNNTKQEYYYSPKKTQGGGGGSSGGGGSNGDRLKRDEWSEGAVSILLEAYEAKWILRNRAKLKGQDWEDVAKFVSARVNSIRSPKTQTQCKNKIESMKKRYRSESAMADVSSWPLFPRLDLLLRGTSGPPPPPPANPCLVVVEPPVPAPPPPPQLQTQPPPAPPPPPANPCLVVVVEPPVPPAPSPKLQAQPPPPSQDPPLIVGVAQISNGSNGIDPTPQKDGGGDKLSDHLSDKNARETDSSTPALYSDKRLNAKTLKKRTEKRKRKTTEDWEIAESIRWLAEVVVRSEQARMDTMRELEKMRVEAESKKSEMDLKRTEILANTQLEIARLFAGVSKGVDSSLRIGRN